SGTSPSARRAPASWPRSCPSGTVRLNAANKGSPAGTGSSHRLRCFFRLAPHPPTFGRRPLPAGARPGGGRSPPLLSGAAWLRRSRSNHVAPLPRGEVAAPPRVRGLAGLPRRGPESGLSNPRRPVLLPAPFIPPALLRTEVPMSPSVLLLSLVLAQPADPPKD